MYNFLKIVYIFALLKLTVAEKVINYDYESNYFPELKYVNESVEPCENFYKFACGNFEKYNPRPENEIVWDNFLMLQKEIYNLAIEILNTKIRQTDSNAVKKVKDFYWACMTPKSSADLTTKPLLDVFDKLGGWPLLQNIPKSRQEFSWNFVGDVISLYGIPLFFSFSIHPNVMNSSENYLYITNDKFPASSKEISFLQGKEINIALKNYKNNDFISTYLQYVIDITKKLIRADLVNFYEQQITEGLEKVLELFKSIGNIQYMYNEQKNDDIYIENIADLQSWTDSFSANFTFKINWLTFLTKVFSKSNIKITDDTKVDLYPDIIQKVLTIVEKTSSDTNLNVIFTKLAAIMAPDVNLKMWEMHNDFLRKINSTVYSRSEYCIKKILNTDNLGLNFAISHQIQNYFYDVRKLSKSEEMIDNIFNAFNNLLIEKDWLDDASREFAHKKIEQISRLVALPNFAYEQKKIDEYYSKLRVCKHDHFGNSHSLRSFNFKEVFDSFDNLNKRNIWDKSTLRVNAFYLNFKNKFTLPLAIMNPPFFTDNSSLVDFSRIGFLIGHELTHAFDNKGIILDETGSFNLSLWSTSFYNEFAKRNNCLVDQYSKYFIEEIKQHVPDITVNENIADNGGIRTAFRAFQNLYKSHYAKEISNVKYSPEQLFFISYATMLCRVDTKESLTNMYTDVHSPNRFRVIGTLSNMEEFSKAFNCPIGANMNPVKKCILW